MKKAFDFCFVYFEVILQTPPCSTEALSFLRTQFIFPPGVGPNFSVKLILSISPMLKNCSYFCQKLWTWMSRHVPDMCLVQVRSGAFNVHVSCSALLLRWKYSWVFLIFHDNGSYSYYLIRAAHIVRLNFMSCQNTCNDVSFVYLSSNNYEK